MSPLEYPCEWPVPLPDPRRSITTKAARPTGLQHFHRAARDVLLDARDVLTDDQYRALLTIVQEHLIREHARVGAGDLARLRRAS